MVVARVEVPATTKVEEADKDEVAVIDPPVITPELSVAMEAKVEVSVEIVPEIAERKEEKRLVEEALVE